MGLDLLRSLKRYTKLPTSTGVSERLQSGLAFFTVWVVVRGMLVLGVDQQMEPAGW